MNPVEAEYIKGKEYTISSSIDVGFSPRVGYSFLHWKDVNSERTYNPNDKLTITTDAFELSALWQILEYSIEYKLDGGENNPQNPSTYNIESVDIILLDATKENYAFDKWVDSEGNQITSILHGSTGNKSLSAIWTPVYVDLTYDTNYENQA